MNLKNHFFLFFFVVLAVFASPCVGLFSEAVADITVKSPSGGVVEIQGIKMVSIPSGTFSMGQSGFAEPVHSVTLSAFKMGMYEITQRQYKTVIGSNPSSFTGDDNLPVEQMSWFDAIKFCNAVSTKEGLQPCYNESSGACDFSKNGFRLPTEAEWEYACRAGSTTNYNFGDEVSDLARAAWYFSNSGNKSHPVGEKTPNAWGLFDMYGNILEWCQDLYGSYTNESATNPTGAHTGSTRVIRGGGWGNDGNACRSAYRDYIYPYYWGNFIGFRVVRR